MYAPLAFTPGRTGRLFTEFALALAGSVVVSGFIALTLTPMMCSLLRHNPKPWFFDRWMERVFVAATGQYTRFGFRCCAIAGVLLLLVMLASCWRAPGALLVNTKPASWLRWRDRGVILAVINGPDGATLDYTITPGPWSVWANYLSLTHLVYGGR